MDLKLLISMKFDNIHCRIR